MEEGVGNEQANPDDEAEQALTNPLTGQYFEFGHWTESVRAYYTKVQYRYKGGNYLVWLRDIGYAEDPNYIREVIRVLKTL